MRAEWHAEWGQANADAILGRQWHREWFGAISGPFLAPMLTEMLSRHCARIPRLDWVPGSWFRVPGFG